MTSLLYNKMQSTTDLVEKIYLEPRQYIIICTPRKPVISRRPELKGHVITRLHADVGRFAAVVYPDSGYWPVFGCFSVHRRAFRSIHSWRFSLPPTVVLLLLLLLLLHLFFCTTTSGRRKYEQTDSIRRGGEQWGEDRLKRSPPQSSLEEKHKTTL